MRGVSGSPVLLTSFPRPHRHGRTTPRRNPHAMFFLSNDLRIADADREAAVEFIKHHYAAGRLSDAEMSARVDAAYAARFESQLERLTWDLPELLPERRERSGPLAGRLGPAAKVGGIVAAGAGIVALMPPEMWTALLGLGLPMLLMALFTFAPVALPVLLVLWLARSVAGPPRRGELPPPRRHGAGWWW